jgi:type IV secretory pathway ATPase VirB11/archaellum biosynthesis ATPase
MEKSILILGSICSGKSTKMKQLSTMVGFKNHILIDELHSVSQLKEIIKRIL